MPFITSCDLTLIRLRCRIEWKFEFYITGTLDQFRTKKLYSLKKKEWQFLIELEKVKVVVQRQILKELDGHLSGVYWSALLFLQMKWNSVV